MNVKDLVARACRRMGQPAPVTVLASTDPTYLQMGGLLEEVGQDLAEYPWQFLRKRVTKAAVGAEDQGTLATFFGDDYKSLVPRTFWNVSRTLPITGPLGDEQWQFVKAMPGTGPVYTYRIENGRLYITPAPTAGDTLSFVIVRKWWVHDSGGTPVAEYFQDDNSVPVFEDELMLLGLKWRWKYEKGQPYAEDLKSFEEKRADRLSKQVDNPTLDMSAGRGGLQPGIFVPAGSWGVP